MENPRAYIVTYTGDGVAMLPSVGVFQAGTRAWVDAETAEAARRLPHFVVTGPDGVSARVVEEMAPPPPAPPEPEPPEPVAAAPEPVAAAPEPPPAPAAPTRPARRGRQSAVMAAVRSEETTEADAGSSDKK